MIKIVTVLGARPQFIKASVVSRAFEQAKTIHEVLVHTGQHFDKNMSAVFFKELQIKRPKYNLGVRGGGHGQMTGRMLSKVEKVLLKEKPDIVLVYGDTNSTLAGALAAAKLNIPVAHVEAGLRSFNSRMPEEINRVLTDRISRWLFTPTLSATKNLKAEGVAQKNIFEVGDVMYDLALKHGLQIKAKDRVLKCLKLPPFSYVLATVHRAENSDDAHRMKIIIEALKNVSEAFPVIWPVHPRTRQTWADKCKLLDGLPNFHLIEPVGYFDMMQLEKYAALIVTDSGGVQKEAFFHKVPCVTLRDESEWMELIDSGWNRLMPLKSKNHLAREIFASFGKLGKKNKLFGNGDAAMKIARILQNFRP
jgi:UDP-GlcNAc3NAcA epimerase